MSNERLVYIPLGGAGEIGMNLYLYGWGAPGEERWIMADCGVTFPNMDTSPGVDLIMADTSFIEGELDRLEAIFITHAHEDHIGALGILWNRIGGRPVYARLFTARVVRSKLESSGADIEKARVAPAYPEMIKAGPFKVGFMPVSHSIPEASGLVIDTPAGRVFHTGDFKLDPEPQLGEGFEEAPYRDMAGDGLLALVCDSTNVPVTTPGRSEADILEHINTFMAEAEGMIVATTFASNIARLKMLADAAKANDKAILVLGRAMHRMIGYGRETGILPDFPGTIDPEEAASVPRQHLFVLATGSQGEHRGAAASLARDKHLGIELSPGDTFLFSSKTIPGNEVAVGKVVNQLVDRGVTVVEGDPRYHVSGHANGPDLARFHDLVSPQLVVPMHGEIQHLVAHGKLAHANDRKAAIAKNGQMVILSGPDAGEVEDVAEAGRTYLDGTVLIGARDGIVRDRIRMAMRGQVAVSVVIDEEGQPIDGAWAEPIGLPDPQNAELAVIIEEEVGSALSRAGMRELRSDASIEELVTRATHRACKDSIGKKPMVTVMIQRLEAE